MVKYSSAHLDLTFGALADPTRRAILARLAQGEANVSELAEPFHISLPAISKHLRILEEAGLLQRTIDGRVHHCRVNAAPIREAMQWIETYRRFWETQLDALADYLSRNSSNEASSWQNHKPNSKPRSSSNVSSTRRARRSSRPGPTRKR